MTHRRLDFYWMRRAWLVMFLVSACQPQVASFPSGVSGEQPLDDPMQAIAVSAQPTATPLPTRPIYQPGELVDYIAQPGDTLPALAVRFNTTEEEILQANPIIPRSATTMPPGMPMKIPIYYTPFWGNPFKILPDSLFVNGPSMMGFDSQQFVDSQPGWLNGYVEYAAGASRSGVQIVDLVALNFSLSPSLLLALLEYQSGALSQPDPPAIARIYPMGYQARERKGLYRQLLWSANTLNNGYYGWRTTHLTYLEHADGRTELFDPWQNAATVALHHFFHLTLPLESYRQATSPEGFVAIYHSLFGDPWSTDQPHIPGSLEQPSFTLPFLPGGAWSLTGGPHTGWGTGDPLAALDFAPPSTMQGCVPTDHWATAVAPGVVVRSEEGVVVLDLDGDGDERTGWNVFYLHVGTVGRAPLGASLQTGDPVGHPSCEAAKAPAPTSTSRASTTGSGSPPKARWDSTWKDGLRTMAVGPTWAP